MRPPTSPLLGYNTNIRHNGKLYHIQTEDSGVNRPHIITHLFADGGRIVASTKTDYAQHLADQGLPALVKAKMQEQHKAMCIALRDGHYDTEPQTKPAAPAVQSKPVTPPAAAPRPRVDVETLERAAQAKLAGSAALGPRVAKRAATAANNAARDGAPRKAPARAAPKPHKVKTLDDVIRSYLDDDADAER